MFVVLKGIIFMVMLVLINVEVILVNVLLFLYVIIMWVLFCFVFFVSVLLFILGVVFFMVILNFLFNWERMLFWYCFYLLFLVIGLMIRVRFFCSESRLLFLICCSDVNWCLLSFVVWCIWLILCNVLFIFNVGFLVSK